MDALPEGRERRLSLRLLNYWRDQAAGRPFPRFTDIDGGAIADMWTQCFVLDCRVPGEPAFAYIGPSFEEWAGARFGGQPVSAAPKDNLLGIGAGFYGQVLRKKVPITMGGEFVDAQGRMIQYRSIICPLSEDGETIDHLLGGANCRVMPAA
ncbi:MAG: PAS domain-containing protein [Alphaproteobacteria bacterium]